MLTLNTKKLNQNVLLAGLCALITLVPVLNYALTVPSEVGLTLGAWALSNGLISAFLFLHGRMERSAATHS